MKSVLFPIFALLLLCSCNKDDESIPGFDMEFQADFKIPPGIGIFEVHHFQLKNIPTRYQDLLNVNQKSDADIKGIITQSAAIGGIFGDANLDFIDQVSLRVFNETDPNDYVEIAYRQPVPLEPGNALDLIPSLANSKRFLTGTRCGLDVVLWLRRTTSEETDVRLNLKMKAQY